MYPWPVLLGHFAEFSLDAASGFTLPRTCIGEEVADDGVARVPAVVVLGAGEGGHRAKVGRSIGGNFFPISADFACDSVERSCHNLVFYWFQYSISKFYAKLTDFLNGVGNDVRLIQSVPFNYLLAVMTNGGLRESPDRAIFLPFVHRDFVSVVHMLVFYWFQYSISKFYAKPNFCRYSLFSSFSLAISRLHFSASRIAGLTSITLNSSLPKAPRSHTSSGSCPLGR